MKLSDTKDIVEDEVRVNYNIGERVSVCSNSNNVLNGNIVSIEDDHYIIQPEVSTYAREFERLKDGNVKVYKNQMFRLPYSKNERNVFMFDDYDGKSYEKFVDACLPTGSVLINSFDLEKMTSFNKLNKLLLEEEDISLNEFTEKELSSFKKILEDTNTNLKVNNRMDKKWGVDKNVKEKRDNFGLVNNKILDGLLEFYGSYPLFNNKLDSITSRIKR